MRRETWADSCAVISGRRVLITPAESLQMHCLDLVDGSPQWSLDRGDLAFLACVDRGVAVVVGNRQLTAVELDTGKFAAGWPLKLPEGSLPSGRGYYAGGHYYLPLNVSGAGRTGGDPARPARDRPPLPVASWRDSWQLDLPSGAGLVAKRGLARVVSPSGAAGAGFVLVGKDLGRGPHKVVIGLLGEKNTKAPASAGGGRPQCFRPRG